MNIKDFFRKPVSKVQKWYRERTVRRVFLIALVAFLVCFLIAQFDPSGITLYAAILCAIVALCASIGDTWISSKQFKEELKIIRARYFSRMVEIYDTGVQMAKDCFGPEEQQYIKKRQLGYKGTIFLKSLFLIVLIIILVGNG